VYCKDVARGIFSREGMEAEAEPFSEANGPAGFGRVSDTVVDVVVEVRVELRAGAVVSDVDESEDEDELLEESATPPEPPATSPLMMA
jgi:hypothetical protein